MSDFRRVQESSWGRDKVDKCQLCLLICFSLLDWQTVKYTLGPPVGVVTLEMIAYLQSSTEQQ